MTLYESLIKNVGIGWSAFWPGLQNLLGQNGYKGTVCMERTKGESLKDEEPEWVEILLDKKGFPDAQKELRKFLMDFGAKEKRGRKKQTYIIDRLQLQVELSKGLISPGPAVAIFTTSKDSYKKMQEMHKNLGGRVIP